MKFLCALLILAAPAAAAYNPRVFEKHPAARIAAACVYACIAALVCCMGVRHGIGNAALASTAQLATGACNVTLLALVGITGTILIALQRRPSKLLGTNIALSVALVVSIAAHVILRAL